MSRTATISRFMFIHLPASADPKLNHDGTFRAIADFSSDFRVMSTDPEGCDHDRACLVHPSRSLATRSSAVGDETLGPSSACRRECWFNLAGVALQATVLPATVVSAATMQSIRRPGRTIEQLRNFDVSIAPRSQEKQSRHGRL
jgi:hypothetical protein